MRSNEFPSSFNCFLSYEHVFIEDVELADVFRCLLWNPPLAS